MMSSNSCCALDSAFENCCSRSDLVVSSHNACTARLRSSSRPSRTVLSTIWHHLVGGKSRLSDAPCLCSHTPRPSSSVRHLGVWSTQTVRPQPLDVTRTRRHAALTVAVPTTASNTSPRFQLPEMSARMCVSSLDTCSSRVSTVTTRGSGATTGGLLYRDEISIIWS